MLFNKSQNNYKVALSKPSIIFAKRKAILNIYEETKLFITSLYKTSYIKFIINARLDNKKHKEICSMLNISYRKTQDVQAKSKRKFQLWQEKNKILLKIALLEGNTSILTPLELKPYFQNYTNEVLYLLKTLKKDSYIYYSDFNIYIINNENPINILNCIKTLPRSFKTSHFQFIKNFYSKKFNLSENTVNKIISIKYKNTSQNYYSYKMNINDMCAFILKEYYPNGINAYNIDALKKFYLHLTSEFESVRLKQTTIALTNQICRAGILCNKGIYKPKQSYYISNELYSKICSYMLRKDKKRFSIDTIFNIFEKDLKTFNVKNKYYMLGILHESGANQFNFSKDYISKKQ